MKRCDFCDAENPDHAVLCVKCNTMLETPRPMWRPRARKAPDMSSAEKRFWERMTFRQFGILMIRIQAVWLLFYGFIYFVYFVWDLRRIFGSDYNPVTGTSTKIQLFFEFLRIILYIAAAVLLIQRAEQILNWLVRDLIPNEPPDTAPTTAAPPTPAEK
jgi:hypothetical protein